MRIYVVFLICSSALLVYAANSSKRNDLFAKIRSSAASEIPTTPHDEPLPVQFGIYLINVADADTVKKEVEIDAWLVLKWPTAVKWNSHKFDGNKVIAVPNKYVWVPDISIFNSVNRLVNDAPDTLVLNNEGEAMWMPKVRIRALCDVDAHKMASNISCGFQFGSWAHNDNFFNITKIDDNAVVLDHYFEGSRFEIVGASSQKETVQYPCCHGGNYSYIQVNISFKERIPSPVMNGYVQGLISWR